MSKHKNVNTNATTDFWEVLNKCLAANKEMALKKQGSMAKYDLIEEAVSTLLIISLKQIHPVPPLLKRCLAGERVSFNMILDSLGENGILLGATAYRLAEQLELEIPDDDREANKQVITTFVNGVERPEWKSENSQFTTVYRRYFVQNFPSMFFQNGYLLKLIQKSDHDEFQKNMAGSLIVIQVGCKDNALVEFLHDCLYGAYFHGFSEGILQVLCKIRTFYSNALDTHKDVLGESDLGSLVLTTAILTNAVENIEKIINKKQGTENNTNMG
jgi:hypothetical protein